MAGVHISGGSGDPGAGKKSTNELFDYTGIKYEERIRGTSSKSSKTQGDVAAFRQVNKVAMKQEQSCGAVSGDLLQKRYDKHTVLDTYEDGWPKSYGYMSSKEDPALVQYHAVDARISRVEELIPVKSMPVWMRLSPASKDQLYLILGTPLHLYSRIIYDNNELKWVCATGSTELCDPQLLDVYAFGIDKSMLSFLQGERSIEEMQASVESLMEMSSDLKYLADHFEAACLSGMTNGDGRTAAFSYIQSLVSLTTGFEGAPSIPTANVRHISSTTTAFSCSLNKSLSDSVTTCSESSDRSSSTTSPKSKRRRLDEGSKTSKQKIMSEESELTRCKKGNGYCDLVVVSRDIQNDLGKYLFLIEIHSHGTSWNAFVTKFIQEMICVLQGQSEVFGLIFGEVQVMLLRAIRKRSGKILIRHHTYVFNEGKYVAVRDFQMLTMDIFSCLAYSLMNIDV